MKYQSALGTIHQVSLTPKPGLHTLNVRRECLLSLASEDHLPAHACHGASINQKAHGALSEKMPQQAISYIPSPLLSILATKSSQMTGPKPKARKMPIKRGSLQPQKGIEPFHPLPHVVSSF